MLYLISGEKFVINITQGSEMTEDSTGEDARKKEEWWEGKEGGKSRDILRDVASVDISYFSSLTNPPRTREPVARSLGRIFFTVVHACRCTCVPITIGEPPSYTIFSDTTCILVHWLSSKSKVYMTLIVPMQKEFSLEIGEIERSLKSHSIISFTHWRFNTASSQLG